MRTWKDDADAADDWRRKGDQVMELLSRRDAVRMALHEAIRKPESEGVAWLKQGPIVDQLKRLDELVGQLQRPEDYTDAIDMAQRRLPTRRVSSIDREMALFEFDLARVEDIVPWGDPGNKSLSWFALTDGFFRMVVGEQILFRYTEDILRHWGQADQDAGYQIAALARDVLGSAAAGTTSLPPFVERLAADWELLTRLQTRCSEFEEASTSADDMRYHAWRWLGERSPWASYLVEGPRLSFVRVGDNVHIHWDNRNRVVDGIRVWTAQYGVHTLPVDVFVAECRDFAARLLGEMGTRILQIETGLAVPQVAVDIASLREQQEVWRTEFESYFKAHEPDVPWDDAEGAVRAMAKRCGIDLPA